jgi:hypothetical protein
VIDWQTNAAKQLAAFVVLGEIAACTRAKEWPCAMHLSGYFTVDCVVWLSPDAAARS